MTPRSTAPDQRPLRPDPEYGKTPTESDIFIALVELLGAAIILVNGMRFLADPFQPDILWYGAFIVTAVLVVDAARRLWRIPTGKANP